MIQLKNKAQIELMQQAGRITGEALLLAGEAVKEGVSTKQLDNIVRAHIEKCGARPSFLGYGGFPGSACISINDEVIHGIPSKSKILKEGDIVKIDVGAFYKGFHGDSANTFAVGKISEEAEKLISVTKESFMKAIEVMAPNCRVGDIGNAVDSHVKIHGFSVVRKYIGHGVGKELHEAPDVPNYGTPGRGPRIVPGTVIAIEPMVNVGSCEVKELPDGWTVKTADGKLSAHYEHTVAMTEEGLIILTKVD
ncbi:MAG: type I methionyl aminopeptidase [Ruminococcaceae bacterium]|nr:type I methionyl aminopeptidase [Oscillospiraceae bacterium]